MKSMGIKVLKSLLFIAASIAMGVCLLFIPQSSGPVSVSYITVLGIYLSLDIATMINSTACLPKGKFKELRAYKYVISFIAVLALIGLCLTQPRDAVSTALTSFCSAIMIVIACLIGGLEGNKLATGIGEEVGDD